MLLSSLLIELLAQANPLSTISISPSLFWLGGGVALCLIELFLPISWANQFKFVPLIMGISALIVAVFSWRYILLQDRGLQIAYWMGLSTACLIWVRPMILKRKKVTVPDATEAWTLTEILPGQTGQVLYEGCVWQARTELYQDALAPKQNVYVLRREGNTLIVLPKHLFKQ